MKIAIDIDDVLAEFQISFLNHLNEASGHSLTTDDIVSYHYTDFLDITWDEVKAHIFDFYETEEFHNLDPVKHSKESISELSRDNFLYIITSRPKSIQKTTEDWLDMHYGDSFTEIILTDRVNGSKVKKPDICEDLGISMIVEDSPEEVDEFVNKGVKVHLLDKPWNRSVHDQDGVIRHSDWKSVINELEV
jgi:uncharacterized HAD superfamily protein